MFYKKKAIMKILYCNVLWFCSYWIPFLMKMIIKIFHITLQVKPQYLDNLITENVLWEKKKLCRLLVSDQKEHERFLPSAFVFQFIHKFLLNGYNWLKYKTFSISFLIIFHCMAKFYAMLSFLENWGSNGFCAK